MIGDNLESDILFGNNSGIATLLVLTGKCRLADLRVIVLRSDEGVTQETHLSGIHKSEIVPDYVMGSMGESAVPAHS